MCQLYLSEGCQRPSLECRETIMVIITGQMPSSSLSGLYSQRNFEFSQVSRVKRSRDKLLTQTETQNKNTSVVLSLCLYTEPPYLWAVLPTITRPDRPSLNRNQTAGTFEESKVLALERRSSWCLLRLLLCSSKACSNAPNSPHLALPLRSPSSKGSSKAFQKASSICVP